MIMQTLIGLFNNTSYLNEEVNGTEPFPSVGVPWTKKRPSLAAPHLHVPVPYFNGGGGGLQK
jgi:hypothetical protein